MPETTSIYNSTENLFQLGVQKSDTNNSSLEEPLRSISSSSHTPYNTSSVPRTIVDPGQNGCGISTEHQPNIEYNTDSSSPNSASPIDREEEELLAGVAVQQTPAPPTASLYVGDLSPMVNETDLFRAFSPIGCVLSIRVCRDVNSGKSLGYAYINYQSTSDASRALATLNHISIMGKPCQIMPSQRDPNFRKGSQGNIFIKNLDVSVNETILRNKFQPYGDIIACKVAVDENGISRGYGYVNYSQSESAEQAIADLNGTKLADKVLFVGPHISKRDRINKLEEKRHQFTNIYVRNIDHSVTPQEFHDLFNQYGNVISISLPTKEVPNADANPDDPKNTESQGYGFVNFSSHEDALNAINNLNKKPFKGSELYVSRAQKKNEREFERKQRHFYDKTGRFINYNAGNMANLYIKNLDSSIDDDYLYKTFSPFGKITSARVMTDDANQSRGYGFVCFSNYNDAVRTIQEMDATTHRGKPISISLAQRKDVNQGGGGSGSRNNMMNYMTPSLMPGAYQSNYPIMYQPILGKVAPYAPLPLSGSLEEGGFIPMGPNMASPPPYGPGYQYFSPLPPPPLPVGASRSGPSLGNQALGSSATATMPNMGINTDMSPSMIPYLAGPQMVSPVLSSPALSSPTSPPQSSSPLTQFTFEGGVSPPNVSTMMTASQGHPEVPVNQQGSNSNLQPYYYYVPSIARYQYGYGGVNPNYPIIPGTIQGSGYIPMNVTSPTTRFVSSGGVSPSSPSYMSDQGNNDDYSLTKSPVHGETSKSTSKAVHSPSATGVSSQINDGQEIKKESMIPETFENVASAIGDNPNGNAAVHEKTKQNDDNEEKDEDLVVSLLRTSLADLDDPEAKKQIIGEAIYPHVLAHPKVNGDNSVACRITGVMLDIDPEELINWVDRQPNILRDKINEAYEAYQAYIGQDGLDTTNEKK